MGDASVKDGHNFGLRAYADYHRLLYPGSFRSTAWEEPITAGLAIGLRNASFKVDTERLYPTSAERCDLIVQLPATGNVWIEVKTGFTEVFGDTYEACDATPIKSSKNAIHDRLSGKDIRHDFDKLTSLRKSDADFIGILYLGFDRIGRSLEDGGYFELLAERLPKLATWHQCHEKPIGRIWSDRYSGRGVIRLSRSCGLFWYKSVGW